MTPQKWLLEDLQNNTILPQFLLFLPPTPLNDVLNFVELLPL